MRKMIFVVAMLMVGFGVAQAGDAKKVDEVHVTLVSVEHIEGADIKISPSDYPNGVFVRVKEMWGERPVSAAIFAEKLRAKGFKITEKAEDADVVLLVRSGSLNFKDIDESTDSIAANKLDGMAGVAGAALVTGGLSLLVSDYSFLGNSKPIYSDMIVRFEPGKKTDVSKVTALAGAIKTDANNHMVTRASFEVLTDEWLKAHLKGNAVQPATSTPPKEDNAVTKQ